MLVMGFNPGHDGAVAAVKDRSVLFSLESEKDSFLRHAELAPNRFFALLERLGEVPDVIALGGHLKDARWFPGENRAIEAGYHGSQVGSEREGTFCGQRVKIFSSSHIRSHIMMAAGMAPRDDAQLRAVLVWEGYDGTFYLLDERWSVVREIPVMRGPGLRYAFLYAIADPSYPDFAATGHTDESGKLMALAAYGDAAEADSDVIATVERLLTPEYGPPKNNYRDTPIYNVGVEADVTKVAAALLQERLFETFARVAQEEIPPDIPLYISGGCGLNCDWNTMWRELGHFSSVFVPPCPNDSGSALGTTLDALYAATGDPRVDWDVYCGLEFEWDRDPDVTNWKRRPLQEAPLADALARGRVVAWAQGRWEMGPRALGNRSLLAEPFDQSTRDCLNEIKQREGYRPIAPCCRIEDAGKVFDRDFHDPYMLYFRMVTFPAGLGAVTHVDGSARVQTVTQDGNKPLHDLLSVFGERYGAGVLCNTSLNYKRMGFINKMSDLAHYCETQGVRDMVVGDAWFQRVQRPLKLSGPRLVPPRLVKTLIEQNVPEGAIVVVISEEVGEMLELDGRQGWAFSQHEDGAHRNDHTADSEDAIAKLEELREKGASHLAIPKPDLGWLELHPGFREHVENRYRMALPGKIGCLIFALEEAAHMNPSIKPET
jgi:hydroxymethyl cephem carbamoyltransferase